MHEGRLPGRATVPALSVLSRDGPAVSAQKHPVGEAVGGVVGIGAGHCHGEVTRVLLQEQPVYITPSTGRWFISFSY